MPERIDIRIDDARLSRDVPSRHRLRKTASFEPTDRVPVHINTNQWCALAERNRTTADYLRSPVDNLREQLLNRKWEWENLPDDRLLPAESITITPDFGCLRGVEFPMEIRWSDTQPPKCIHPLTASEQIDALTVPDPAGGLNARMLAWMKAMREAAPDFDIRLNGRPLELSVGADYGGGPIPSAFALAGENLFLWMAYEPGRVHRLMEIVTESFIRCVRFFDELAGSTNRNGIGLGCDAAEMVSPEMFEEFVVPYYQRVYDTFPGRRGFHNCGPCQHLLPQIRDALRIDDYNGFGFCHKPEELAAAMAGRVVLKGGPSPMLIREGPVDAIRDACRHYIETLGAKGGYVLQLGGGAAAGTPIEHYGAMVEAAEQMRANR